MKVTSLTNLKILVLLVATCLLVLYPVLHNDFVNWDDDEYVLVNDSIKSLSGENIKKIFTRDLTGKYHPLTLLSFALEYHFFKLDPYYYHATNLLLHALNVVLVFFFLRFLLTDAALAAIAALLFAVHPLQVEPVAWVSSRKDMLFMLFYLSALIVYLRYVDAPDKIKRSSARALVGVLFVLSLLSKAMAISFPLVLVLMDFYRQRRLTWGLILGKWPYFVISLCYGIFTMNNAQASEAFPNTVIYPLAERVLYSFLAIVLYLIKIVWPLPLSAFYAFTISWPMLFLSVAIVLLGGALVFYTFRKQPLATFCFLFFLLTIWPVLHLLQMNDSVIYERFMYLPSIGMFVLIAHGVKIVSVSPNIVLRRAAIGLFLAWLLFLMVVSHRQTRVWNNSATLWDNVIKHFPKAYAAYNNMGFYMEQQGRFDEAMQYYMRMIEVNPKYAEGYFKLGNILALRFDSSGALRYYSKAIEYNPKHYVAYNNRGNQYLILQMFDRALADYSRSIEINDKYVSAYVNRGMCHFTRQDYEAALRDFKKALELDPHHERAAEKTLYIQSLMSHGN